MENINYKLDHFEGPLDLLLHLIEKDKVDIYNIPINEITQQYLDYVENMEEKDLEIVSSFLLMAATLLEIKSRMLLPKEIDEDGEAKDPREELVYRLLEYKKFKVISAALREKEENTDDTFYGQENIPSYVKKYIPPVQTDKLLEGIVIEDFKELFTEIIRRREDSIDKLRSKFGIIKKERISLSKKIHDVLSYTRKHRSFSFKKLIKNKKEKMDVVVSFLALLELSKMGRIYLEQEKPFSDVSIKNIETDEEMNEELDLKKLEEF